MAWVTTAARRCAMRPRFNEPVTPPFFGEPVTPPVSEEGSRFGEPDQLGGMGHRFNLREIRAQIARFIKHLADGAWVHTGWATSMISITYGAGAGSTNLGAAEPRAVSSARERALHTREVAGLIPAPPTNHLYSGHRSE